MRESGKLYLCNCCNKKKQLNEYYTYKSGKQKGKRVSGKCILCTKDEKKEYRENNKDLIKQYRETFYSKQSDEYFESEKIRKRQWEKDNPEIKKELSKRYRQENKDKLANNRSLYRSKKLFRTPTWLSKEDLAKIKSIYKACNLISNKTGIKHHVDHIIPLQGELVSGLHVPSNLQILPSHINISKGNRYNIDEDIVCSCSKE